MGLCIDPEVWDFDQDVNKEIIDLVSISVEHHLRHYGKYLPEKHEYTFFSAGDNLVMNICKLIDIADGDPITLGAIESFVPQKLAYRDKVVVIFYEVLKLMRFLKG